MQNIYAFTDWHFLTVEEHSGARYPKSHCRAETPSGRKAWAIWIFGDSLPAQTVSNPHHPLTSELARVRL